MSGFRYSEFSKTGSILLNAEEKDELFGYIDRLKAENAKLRELLWDMWNWLAPTAVGGGAPLKGLRGRMHELGVDE